MTPLRIISIFCPLRPKRVLLVRCASHSIRPNRVLIRPLRSSPWSWSRILFGSRIHFRSRYSQVEIGPAGGVGVSLVVVGVGVEPVCFVLEIGLVRRPHSCISQLVQLKLTTRLLFLAKKLVLLCCSDTEPCALLRSTWTEPQRWRCTNGRPASTSSTVSPLFSFDHLLRRCLSFGRAHILALLFTCPYSLCRKRRRIFSSKSLPRGLGGGVSACDAL